MPNKKKSRKDSAMKRAVVQMHMKLPFKLIKRKDWILATCPLFDVSSQGETAEEARQNLCEALTAFILSCLKRNTLDAVLRECGLTPSYKTASFENKLTVKKEDYIDIPIPFMIGKEQRSRCHA